jgi:hypothetical protein
MNPNELQTSNANYDLGSLVTRVRDLFTRDDGLLGGVIQRSVLVRSGQATSSEIQHAITKIDVLPKLFSAGPPKTIDYGTLLFVAEAMTREELLARLNGFSEKHFKVGDQILTAPSLGFSDRYEPSRSSYSEWPCRVFDISFGPSIGSGMLPVLRPRKSLHD